MSPTNGIGCCSGSKKCLVATNCATKVCEVFAFELLDITVLTLLDITGIVKLADFGVASHLTETVKKRIMNNICWHIVLDGISFKIEI